MNEFAADISDALACVRQAIAREGDYLVALEDAERILSDIDNQIRESQS